MQAQIHETKFARKRICEPDDIVLEAGNNAT